MLRFVVVHHIVNDENSHYDLMFEDNDVLKTYQISSEIEEDILQLKKITAKQIQDHRLIYLEYEGEISGNRGYVKIFDKGNYRIKRKDDTFLEFELCGSVFKGNLKFSLKDIEKSLWEIIYLPI